MSAVDELLATAGADLLHAPTETSRTIEATSDRWRRHIYTDNLGGGLEEVSLIGLTSQLKPIKGSFEDYAAKVTAGWAVDNHATWAPLARDEAVGLIAAERTRKLNRDANRGTSIHRIIDQVREGKDIRLTNPDAAPYLAAVKAFLAEARPEFILGEVAVFNRTHRYAGKFDVLMRLAGYPELGLRIGDWKTRAKHDVYLENAAQLAGYAKAEYYVLDGQRHPMPDLDGGLIVTFTPDGTWAAHPVDLDAAWPLCEAAVACYQVEKIVKPFGTQIHPARPQDPNPPGSSDGPATGEGHGPRPSTVAGPPPTPAPAPDDDIVFATTGLRARLGDAVRALGGVIPAVVNDEPLAWPDRVARFADGGPRTWAGVELVEQFVKRVETAAGMPFYDSVLPPPPEPEPADPPAPTEPPGPSPELVRFNELCGDMHDDEKRCLVLAATGGNPIEPNRLNANHIAGIEALLEMAGLGYGGFAYEPVTDGLGGVDVTWKVNPNAEVVLVERSGGRQALVDAGKAAADRLGRPRPRSAAQVVADPVLAAVLAVELNSKQQPSKETQNP